MSAQQLELSAPASAIVWLGERAHFALGDGAIFIADTRERIEAHDGAILCAALHPDENAVLTGGDDGRIVSTSLLGPQEVFALNGKWIDHLVASADSGALVAAAGKEAIVFKNGAESHRFAAPSSIGGLALNAKGRRLAFSHYGGATLRYALMSDGPETLLKWAGSHLAIALSPEADYVITAMQEMELHGWKLPEKRDLRMSGYAAKTKSFSWDKRGRWLATSGADCAVLWPFSGKLGPQGKQPAMLAPRQALVTQVAFHPRDEIVALGWNDGAVSIANVADGATAIVREPTAAPITALAWSNTRMQLAAADEAGAGVVMELQAR
ncbi:MAG: WD40 repeat domain-containing protein [Hyphomonadaceae bacterium]